VEARLCPFGDSANLEQDGCTVCAERTIVLENILDALDTFWTHPMELLGDMGHVDSCFGPFGDGANIGAR
jgi:hypothetical protein